MCPRKTRKARKNGYSGSVRIAHQKLQPLNSFLHYNLLLNLGYRLKAGQARKA